MVLIFISIFDLVARSRKPIKWS